MRFLMVLCLATVPACQDNEYARSQTAGNNERPDAEVDADPDLRPDARLDTANLDTDEPDPRDAPPDAPTDSDLPETVEDVPASDAADASDATVPDCNDLDEDDCLGASHCIVDLAPARGTYECRPTRNDCETRPMPDCDDDCWWDWGECYCPPDSDCDCGNGPAPQCRPRTDLRPCHTGPGAFCFEEETCCPTGPGDLGQCSPHGLCDGGACGAIVSFRTDGGLCEHGPCRYEVHVLRGGHISVESEDYTAGPMDARLDPAQHAEIEALLRDIDVDALDDGYGPCCEAASDGSDLYITFYRHGPPTRTIRVSDRQAPPPALRRLVEIGEYGTRLAGPARAATSPALTWPPALIRPPVTCQTPVDPAGARVHWSLEGPNGELLGTDQFRWVGPRPELPFRLRTSGDAEMTGPYTTEIQADDGRWRLTVRAVPGLRPPRFGPSPLTLTAHIDDSTGTILAGLVVSNQRGILFATDTGLSGLDDTGAVPWTVELVRQRCPAHPGGTQVPLRFRTDDDEFIAYGGQWARLQTGHGYDLLVHVVRAFDTGREDSWNYEYFALAMPATDVCE